MKPEDVVEAFYRALARDLDERPGATSRAAGHRVFVTALIEECPRRALYSMAMPPLEDRTSSIRLWIGRKLHEASVLGCQAEVRVEYGPISGRVDEYCDSGVLLEKKTTRKLPPSPVHYHVRQVEVYKMMLEKLGKPVKQAFILYIDIESMDVAAFDVTSMLRPSEVVETEVAARAGELLKAMAERALPPPKPGPGCRFCQFFALCARGVFPPEGLGAPGGDYE